MQKITCPNHQFLSISTLSVAEVSSLTMTNCPGRIDRKAEAASMTFDVGGPKGG
ncbi:hypothetical protein SynBIOSE41_03658 [Synechococcus sp. BIOS-E4-1]|nr:hypothetical protein SynBIOSE41_03658 [Synechococcus sp. BIOS-E4-1]